MGIEGERGRLLRIDEDYKIGLPIALEENYSSRDRIDDRPCGVCDHYIHSLEL